MRRTDYNAWCWADQFAGILEHSNSKIPPSGYSWFGLSTGISPRTCKSTVDDLLFLAPPYREHTLQHNMRIGFRGVIWLVNFRLWCVQGHPESYALNAYATRELRELLEENR